MQYPYALVWFIWAIMVNVTILSTQLRVFELSTRFNYGLLSLIAKNINNCSEMKNIFYYAQL